MEKNDTEKDKITNPLTDPDHFLVCLLKQGDESAISDLIKRYRPGLENYCRGYFINERDTGDRAVEASMDTLERVRNDINKFDHSRGTFSNWVYMLAKTMCIDLLNKLEGRKRKPRSNSKKRKTSDPPDYIFPKYASIQRGRNWSFTGSTGRVDQHTSEEDGETTITEAWDHINPHVANSRDIGANDKTMSLCSEWLMECREDIEEVIYERTHTLTPEEQEEYDSIGCYLYTIGKPNRNVFSGGNPDFLYRMPLKYLNMLFDSACGSKVSELAKKYNTDPKTINTYFNRLEKENRKGPERKKGGLKLEIEEWQKRKVKTNAGNTTIFSYKKTISA